MEVRRVDRDEAQEGVLERLADRHDHFSELELVYRAEGRIAEAEGAHWYALRLLRAYKAEMDDEKP